MSNKSRLTKAFTLAEVLITLAIIGVIAAISVPSLIQRTNSAELKVAYKKAFAIANQAFDQALYDGNLKPQTTKFDSAICTNNFNVFKSYFKIVKSCTSGNNDQCWDSTGEKLNVGQPTINEYAFIDNSGMAWSLYYNAENILLVDTNGFKGPNWYGKDRWIFIPAGSNNIRVAETGTAPTFPDVITTYLPDRTAYDLGWCQHPPCYYQSWLAGKD